MLLVFHPRYAMKAAPTAAILRIFNSEGLVRREFVHEVERAAPPGLAPNRSPEFPRADDFRYWLQDKK